jgi:diketogulonate reductase-like aldo/keto reductase
MNSIMDQSYRLPSGYPMPVLGLGTWGLVGAACERIVSQALELGYRHLDTAELYDNEQEIGRAMAGAERADLFLVSKVSSANLHTKDVIRACRQSLDRLRTGYLDLYLIHWPNDEVPVEETMDALQYLVEERLVRSIGVSNFDVGRLQEAMDASDVPISTNQVEYHPYRPRRELPQFCAAHGIALTAYSPFARGRVLRDPLLLRIGHAHGKSAAQVCLRWLLQKGALVIPKAASADHLKENRDMDGWELSTEDMQQIDELGIEMKVVDATYT